MAAAAADDTEDDLPGAPEDGPGPFVGVERLEKRDANRATFPPPPPPPPDFDGVETEATLAEPPAGTEERPTPGEAEAALALPYLPTPGGYTALSDPATEPPPALSVDLLHPPGEVAEAADDAPPQRFARSNDVFALPRFVSATLSLPVLPRPPPTPRSFLLLALLPPLPKPLPKSDSRWYESLVLLCSSGTPPQAPLSVP